MSMHLVDCAAALKLEASWKLALMAFADSADRQDRIGFPGLEQVQLWSGLSRSRAFEVVNELEAMGLLRKHRGGRKGRRAEYIVLPNGCCSEHGPIEPKGSDVSDSAPRTGSGPSDPETTTTTSGSDTSDPESATGSGQGPTHRTPSPTTTTNPPTPAPRGGCPRHLDTPGPNCRRCGTTPRQADAAEKAAAQERKRAAAAADVERARREREEADRRFDPVKHQTRVSVLRSSLEQSPSNPIGQVAEQIRRSS